MGWWARCPRHESVFLLQLREEDYVADGGGAREHHDQAVDADADAACGRHAVFEGFDEIVVDFLLFAAGLVLEALTLHIGIIEFAVAWGNFLAVDDELIDLHGFAAGGDFGERHELGGDAGDEAGIEIFLFDEFFKNLLHDLVVFHVGGNFHTFFLAALAALLGRDVEKVLASSFFDQIVIARAFPGASQIDGAQNIAFFVFVVDVQAAAKFFGEGAGQFLDEVGHFFKVRERPVGFEHGELGIVTTRDAFVAKVAVEFENFRKTANEQALEEELGRDAQGEWHGERIVIGLKRASSCTAGYVLEHRRLDFEEVTVLEKAANFGYHEDAFDENIGRLGVAHEVEMALAVLDFAVSNAVPFVGHGAQGLGEHGKVFDLDGRLAGAGEEGFALDADPVTAIEALPCGGLFFGECFQTYIALDRAVDIADLAENGFAHVAQGDDASCNLDLETFAEIVTELSGSGGSFIPCTVGIDAEFSQLSKLVAANGDQFCFG